jgi:hypothetical protein
MLVNSTSGVSIMPQTNSRPQFDPQNVNNAALQAFFNLSNKWGLSAAQERTLLGSPASSTFFKWKSEKSARNLDRDTLERSSYLLGIYKDLNILLPSKRAADEWIKKPNSAPLFNGTSALERMLGGSITDLSDVRRYLDAERG